MILFIIIHCVITFFATKCDGHYERSCGVLSKDQHIEVGSDAEVACRSACVSEKVFWTLNNRRLNESLSRVVNSTHTVLLLPHWLLQDPSHHTSTVQCHSEDSHQILGGTTIRVYTKPQNLSCILHSSPETKVDFPRLFKCGWEHYINSPPKVTYSVMHEQKEICTSDVTYCEISTLRSGISFRKKNTIYVRAKTQAWEAHSSDYTFNASQIFKIPPRRVNATAILDHIMVQWNTLPKMGVSGRCQVKYEYMKDEEIIKEVLNKTVAPYEEGRLIIDEVESCRNYSISVRCALDQAPWSDWSPERTIVTNLKNSDVKLDVWRKVSTLHGQIKVHIMWKGIPPNCPGTLNYSISLAPHSGVTSRTNLMRTSCANSPCDIILSQEARRVELTVFYNGDFLAEDSFYLASAFLEDESDGLFCVRNIDTKHELSGLVVRWTAPAQPVSGYVIDWTHNGSVFDWKRTEFANATLRGLADKKPYDIAVTPLFGNTTARSTQISGVCSSFANPGNVTIDNLESYDTGAHVSWSTKPQEICSDAVVNYTVFYGVSHGPQLNVTLTNSTRDVYLKNLNPGTHYSVHVVATARAGTSVSNEGQFKTRLFNPQLIPIISVTGSMLIIFCLGLCCAIRKCYEMPVPNPGQSSLALWPQSTHEKTTTPFNTPSESLCERVYTEEMHQASVMANFKSPVVSDQRNQSTSSLQNYERPFLPARTLHQCSARDSKSLLNPENGQFNPYRSQSAEDSPAPRTSKQNKRFALRQEKTQSYVSLDMFDS